MYIYKIYIFYPCKGYYYQIWKILYIYLLKITLKYLYNFTSYIILIFKIFSKYLLIFTSLIFCVKISVDMSLIYPIYP